MDMLLTKNQFNLIAGNALQELRTELGLSQEKFAGNAGLGRSHYGSIERGEKTINSYNLYKLLTSNGISTSAFFDKI